MRNCPPRLLLVFQWRGYKNKSLLAVRSHGKSFSCHDLNVACLNVLRRSWPCCLDDEEAIYGLEEDKRPCIGRGRGIPLWPLVSICDSTGTHHELASKFCTCPVVADQAEGLGTVIRQRKDLPIFLDRDRLVMGSPGCSLFSNDEGVAPFLRG